MKKPLISLLLCLTLLVSAVPGARAAVFHDITDTETSVAAATLQGLGVVSGTPDGSFQPNGTLTRAQVCVMAVNMMGLSDQVSTYSRRTLFTDVPPGSWYNGYVNLAYSQGIINGYGNGKFGPDDIITYGQLSTILLRMLGYTTKDIGSVWPTDYTAFAARLGLSDGMNLKDNQSITRGQGAVLFYRALKSCVSGSDREYYRSISGLKSTAQAIMLDANTAYGGQSDLVKVYDTQNGTVYYNRSRAQSEALEGSMGQVLFDGSGKVMGFVPESSSYEDLAISSATAAALKDTSGRSLRLSSDVPVIAGGESYTYHNGGYLRLNEAKGRTARVFYDGDGSVLCVYLTGAVAVSGAAAVAESNSPLAELERDLGLSGKNYALTKNGASARAADLAQYDAAWYDAASATLRVSDYKLTGYLESASPSVTAAQTITVAGCSVEVMECAWDSLKNFELGDKMTLILTDDCKVAAVYAVSKVTADMVGVLDTQGRSVTLAGSGLSLSASDMEYDKSARGTLVKVSATGKNELSCTRLSGSAAALDLAAGTLGSMTLAPAYSVYECAASGSYVYDLEGEQGSASADLSAISWTDRLGSDSVSAWHTNSAGQVDVIVLKNVTGNMYVYGKVSGFDSANKDNGAMNSSADSNVTITNASGSSRYLRGITDTDEMYVGIALGSSLSGSTLVARVQELTKVANGEEGSFFRQDGAWFVQLGAEIYPIDEDVQVHFKAADSWKSGEDGMMAALADGCDITLYLDRAVADGGKIRLATAS